MDSARFWSVMGLVVFFAIVGYGCFLAASAIKRAGQGLRCGWRDFWREAGAVATKNARDAWRWAAPYIGPLKAELIQIVDNWAPALRSHTVRNSLAGHVIGAAAIVLPMLKLDLAQVASGLMLAGLAWTFLRTVHHRLNPKTALSEIVSPRDVGVNGARGPGAETMAFMSDPTEPPEVMIERANVLTAARTAPRTMDDAAPRTGPRAAPRVFSDDPLPA